MSFYRTQFLKSKKALQLKKALIGVGVKEALRYTGWGVLLLIFWFSFGTQQSAVAQIDQAPQRPILKGKVLKPSALKVPTVKAQSPTKKELQAWIRQLDSDRFQEREEASFKLSKDASLAVDLIGKSLLEGSFEASERSLALLLQFQSSAPNARTQRRILEILVQQERYPSEHKKAAKSLRPIYIRELIAYFKQRGGELRFSSTKNFQGPENSVSLVVGSKWKGKATDAHHLYKYLKLLKPVKLTLKLRGPTIDVRYLKGISTIFGLKQLSLTQTAITRKSLRVLRKKIPRVQIVLRGTAKLGIQSGGIAGPLVITQVVVGSGAEKAGILQKDRVASVNAEPVQAFEELVEIVSSFKPGDKIQIEVFRKEKKLKFRVTLSGWTEAELRQF